MIPRTIAKGTCKRRCGQYLTLSHGLGGNQESDVQVFKQWLQSNSFASGLSCLKKWWNASGSIWLDSFNTVRSIRRSAEFVQQANWTCFQYNGLHEISLQLLFVNLNNNQTRSWVLGEKCQKKCGISRGVNDFCWLKRLSFVRNRSVAPLVYQLLVDEHFYQGRRGIPGFCLLPLRLSSSILGPEVHLHGQSAAKRDWWWWQLPNRLHERPQVTKNRNFVEISRKLPNICPCRWISIYFVVFLSWNTLNLSWCKLKMWSRRKAWRWMYILRIVATKWETARTFWTDIKKIWYRFKVLLRKSFFTWGTKMTVMWSVFGGKYRGWVKSAREKHYQSDKQDRNHMVVEEVAVRSAKKICLLFGSRHWRWSVPTLGRKQTRVSDLIQFHEVRWLEYFRNVWRWFDGGIGFCLPGVPLFEQILYGSVGAHLSSRYPTIYDLWMPTVNQGRKEGKKGGKEETIWIWRSIRKINRTTNSNQSHTIMQWVRDWMSTERNVSNSRSWTEARMDGFIILTVF